MQNSEDMVRMMKDSIQYIMIPAVRYSPEIGTYASYDIAAYDCLLRDIIEVVFDVTTDRKLALYMTGKFNEFQLDPSQLKEAVLDMLE